MMFNDPMGDHSPGDMMKSRRLRNRTDAKGNGKERQ